MVPHWPKLGVSGRKSYSDPFGQQIGQAKYPRELSWQTIGDSQRSPVQQVSTYTTEQIGTPQALQEPQTPRSDEEITALLNTWLAQNEEHVPQISLENVKPMTTQPGVSSSEDDDLDLLHDEFTPSSHFGNGNLPLDSFNYDEYMPPDQLGPDIVLPQSADIFGVASQPQTTGEQDEYEPSQDDHVSQPHECLLVGTESGYSDHQPFLKQSAFNLQHVGLDPAFRYLHPAVPGYAMEPDPNQGLGSFYYQQAELDVQDHPHGVQRDHNIFSDQYSWKCANDDRLSMPTYQTAKIHTQHMPKFPNFDGNTVLPEYLSIPTTVLHDSRPLKSSPTKCQASDTVMATSQSLDEPANPQEPAVALSSPGCSINRNQVDMAAGIQSEGTSASAMIQSDRAQQSRPAPPPGDEGVQKMQKKRRGLKRFAFEADKMLEPSKHIKTGIELLTEEDRRNAEIIPDTSWWNPTNDIKGDVPMTERELYPYVQTMKRSMMDTSQANDKKNPGTSFHLRWSSDMLHIKGYPASSKEMEAICFEIAKMAVRLHNEGPGFFRMHDQIQQNKIEKEQELTFAERISVIVTILLVSKARVDKLLKHESLGGLVAYPMNMLKNTLANRPYNDKRKEQNRRGKKVMAYTNVEATNSAITTPAADGDQPTHVIASVRSSPGTLQEKTASVDISDSYSLDAVAIEDHSTVNHTEERQGSKSEKFRPEQQGLEEREKAGSEGEEQNCSDSYGVEHSSEYEDSSEHDSKSDNNGHGSHDRSKHHVSANDTGLGTHDVSDVVERPNEGHCEHQHDPSASLSPSQPLNSNDANKQTRRAVALAISWIEAISVHVPAQSSAVQSTAPTADPFLAAQPALSIGKRKRPATQPLGPALLSTSKRSRNASNAGSKDAMVFDKTSIIEKPTIAPSTIRDAIDAEIENTNT